MTASEYTPLHISKPTVVAADKLQISFSRDEAPWLVPGFLNLSHPAKREIRYSRPCGTQAYRKLQELLIQDRRLETKRCMTKYLLGVELTT